MVQSSKYNLTFHLSIFSHSYQNFPRAQKQRANQKSDDKNPWSVWSERGNKKNVCGVFEEKSRL